MSDRYPVELTCDAQYGCENSDHPRDEWGYCTLANDDGTMPGNVGVLSEAVVGHRIVSAEKARPSEQGYGYRDNALVLTLDNGKQVELIDSDDCCAHTTLEGFFLDPDKVDHVITGVGTTDGYTRLHIYADLVDVLNLDVSWSSGNPFYYGYGFHINVKELPDGAAV